MTQQAPSNPPPAILLRARDGLILHQTLYAVARLGVADQLDGGWRSAAELASELKVQRGRALSHPAAPSRPGHLRRERRPLLPQHGRLASSCDPTFPALFALSSSSGAVTSATQASARWRDSIRDRKIRSRTSLPATTASSNLRRDPELARIFDDAMTTMSKLDRSRRRHSLRLRRMGKPNGRRRRQWLPARPNSPRASSSARRARGSGARTRPRTRVPDYLGGDLEARTSMEPCNFFEHVPSGCRAYLMKSIIHDWDDEQARDHSRQLPQSGPPGRCASPGRAATEGRKCPSIGKFLDIAMLQ